jgi:hypothetical protein
MGGAEPPGATRRRLGARAWRDGRLRGEIITALRQTPAGQLERRVAAQIIKVVRIGIAASDRKDAGTQDVFQMMRDAPCISVIGDHSGQCCTETKLSVGT